MLESLKGLFTSHAAGADFSDVAAWAKRAGHGFRRERDGHGFVVDGKHAGTPWRAEWGLPKRSYIDDGELRLRMELALPPDLQMLVLSRPLLERFERQAVEPGSHDKTPAARDFAPEEERWLVMFPKIAMANSTLVRQNFGGVSSLPNEGPAWLEGALADALERACTTLLREQPPLVLMTLRGRIYLRMQMASPGEASVAAAVALFETAGAEAVRVGKARGDEPVSWASTLSSAWGPLAGKPVKRK